MPYTMMFEVDGACRGNGYFNATASWAAVLRSRYGKYRYKAGKLNEVGYTPTNQRAELYAVRAALEWALQRYDDLDGYPDLHVIVKSDSRYVVNCMTDWIYNWLQNGWINAKGREVVNRDIIEDIWVLQNRIEDETDGNVRYRWVPRDENATADEHCNDALDSYS